MKENEIFISGYAKLPSQITASKLYEVIAIALIIDRNSGQIIKADCSLATNLAIEFVRDLLINENINEIQKIQERLNNYYYGSAKKALITAILSCKRKFDEI